MQRPKTTVAIALSTSFVFAASLLAAEFGTVEEELAKVRHFGQELYTRESTVFGQLPSPEEMAAHQMRCRPMPQPKAGDDRSIRFDDATIQRASKLDPTALRQAAGRLQMTVLPLGTTGAYIVEAQGKKELLVVHVLDDTPASGVLAIDDTIIGANGRLFADPEDPRPEMGYALCESQSPELAGFLTLHIVRDRKPVSVRVDLGSTQDFSPTWPYDCEKARQVRADALRYVMDNYPWHRYNFWNGLFLMASGDDEALELARRLLCGGLQGEYEPNTGSSAWSGGYRLTNLCEYYLLTGDSSVLPAIRHQAEGVAWAQYRSGSWSHGGGKGPSVSEPGMASGGYGEVNNAGLGALIGLSLARQCGIEPFGHTLPRSIRFFGPFCGENLGYGLGTPNDSRTGRMDNGMNGMSALVFHLLGERGMAERWARSSCYMWMGRERGHAEAIFSAAWGPVAADLAPRPEFHSFMSHMKWAYEMGRDRQGALNFMRGSRWDLPNMTAAYGLFLYLPEKRLQVLGGNSVFAGSAPAGLGKAADLYKAKQWPQLVSFIEDFLDGTPPARHADYARRLLGAYRRLEAHAQATLGIVERTIEAGNLQTAKLQLDLLAKLMGEESPQAAGLRTRLPTDAKALRDTKREKPKPLVDTAAIMKALKLKKGGIRDGFAHSPDYIKRTNMQGFVGMAADRIAPFVGHFSGGVAGAAIETLAQLRDESLPLVKRMLGDSHPGIRAGAIDVLTRVYASGVSDYRTEIPDDLVQIIKLVRPRLADDSMLVRNSISDFVVKLKVLNDDVFDMVHQLALQGAGVHNFVRHGVKSPDVRTRLCMAIMEHNNAQRISSPSSYIPLICITSAHVEACEPYMQTAVDTLHNPAVQSMYGFFANHPEDAVLNIFSRFPEHPSVMANLPEIITVSFRRGNAGTAAYWDVHQEYPHRVAIQLGPKAIPVIEEFWHGFAPKVKQMAAGEAETPTWWKPDMANGLEADITQWRDTVDLIRCLHDKRPVQEAVPLMVEHCLKDRWWSAWERARIWDKLLGMDPDVLPAVRAAVQPAYDRRVAAIQAKVDDLQARISATKDRKEINQLKRSVEDLGADRADLDRQHGEIKQFVSLAEAIHAPRPTPDHVKTLCSFYLRPPFGVQYPYHKNGNLGYTRPLHASQDQTVRDKLTEWGQAALPAMKRHMEGDKETLAGHLRRLDEETAYWTPQHGRKRGGPLKRIGYERFFLERLRREFRDLTDLIELSSAPSLTKDQLAQLCAIYTRHPWPPQRSLIRDILKRHGPAAEAIIEQRAKDIQPAIAEARETVNKLLGNSVNERVMFPYWKQKLATLQTALAELQAL